MPGPLVLSFKPERSASARKAPHSHPLYVIRASAGRPYPVVAAPSGHGGGKAIEGAHCLRNAGLTR